MSDKIEFELRDTACRYCIRKRAAPSPTAEMWIFTRWLCYRPTMCKRCDFSYCWHLATVKHTGTVDIQGRIQDLNLGGWRESREGPKCRVSRPEEPRAGVGFLRRGR